jgi:hypothetical protein
MTEPTLEIVAKLQEQLARMQGQSGEPPTGTGEALDGKLRITVTSGKVSDVTLEPRAMREASEDLAAAIQVAVNQAIEAHNAQLAAGLPGTPSVDELSRTLDDITSDSTRAIAQAGESMRQAMANVQRISELHRRRPAG